MTNAIYDAIDAGRPLVSDGAMGTVLQDLGLNDGGAPELWNVEKPEVIDGILESYAAAGARFLTTNTFGGTRPRLELHGLADRVKELNAAGARIAIAVAKQHPGVFVLGDIGPTGELMEPMGTLTIEDAKTIFAEQIAGLIEGGVDAILIETMSDLSEAEAAVRASQETAPTLPIIVTMSFDTNFRTMMGTRPEQAVKVLSALGVRIIGANCGRGTDEIRIIAEQLAKSRIDGLYLIVQSNAGLPKLHGDVFEYDGTPEEMARYALEMAALGIDIIGSCCGSTSLHTKAIADALVGQKL
jgi:5-methyltetrahydrofolate--homocysteine methyltransferase